MPIRQNRMWHNPSIGAAFSNLAQAFGPPDAREALGWQKYGQQSKIFQAEQDAYSQIAELYGPGAAAALRAGGAGAFGHFPKVDLYNRSLDAKSPRDLDTSAYAVFGNAGNTFAGLDDQQAADLEEAIAVEGAKPLSTDQLLARETEKALQGGQLDSGVYVMSGLTGSGLEQVLNENGDAVLMPRAGATGMQPAPPQLAKKNVTLQGPNGVVSGVFDQSTGEYYVGGEKVGPEYAEVSVQGAPGDFSKNSAENQYLHTKGVIDSYEAVLGEVDALATRRPDAFGPTGLVKGAMNDLSQTLKEAVGAGLIPEGTPLPELEAQVGQLLRQSLPDGGYDPDYAEAQALMFRWALAEASLASGRGEVTRDLLNRVLERLSGNTLLSSGAGVRAKVQEAQQNAQRLRQQNDGMRANSTGGNGATAQPAPGSTVIRFVHGADGKLMRAE